MGILGTKTLLLCAPLSSRRLSTPGSLDRETEFNVAGYGIWVDPGLKMTGPGQLHGPFLPTHRVLMSHLPGPKKTGRSHDAYLTKGPLPMVSSTVLPEVASETELMCVRATAIRKVLELSTSSFSCRAVRAISTFS